MNTKTMTIETAAEIQSAVADRTGHGENDMTTLIGDYVELGFSQEDVDQVVNEGLAELTRLYGPNSAIALWANAVNAADATEDERRQLYTWDQEAINGVQWSRGGMDAIATEDDAEQAVNETISFIRR